MDIKSCYIGPEISPEQFIAEHFFLYLAKGTIHGYDGNRHYVLKPGEYCLVRKNRLVKYHKLKEADEFEKVIILFDESFLKGFQRRHKPNIFKSDEAVAFLRLNNADRIPDFIRSLIPYYRGSGRIDHSVVDVKREELLSILLDSQPELSGIFFDYGKPGKINLEAFMNSNYKFNVSIERFAYLTGRSISAFKRDFKTIFNDTPNHWLMRKRLQEAYFLIGQKNKKPSEIYLELGFENLSHFSFAFKKNFGKTASELARQKGV